MMLRFSGIQTSHLGSWIQKSERLGNLTLTRPWGIWHLAAFFLSITVQSGWNLAPCFIGTVAISVLFTLPFNCSRGSLLWPTLVHWQLNYPFWPDAQPWDTGILAGLAILMVWGHRDVMLTGKGAVTEVIPGAGHQVP